MEVGYFGWLEAGTQCEVEYGMTLNTKEGYFICPECGEPVYECDWTDEELRAYLCPICQFEEEEIDG